MKSVRAGKTCNALFGEKQVCVTVLDRPLHMLTQCVVVVINCAC